MPAVPFDAFIGGINAIRNDQNPSPNTIPNSSPNPNRNPNTSPNPNPNPNPDPNLSQAREVRGEPTAPSCPRPGHASPDKS